MPRKSFCRSRVQFCLCWSRRGRAFAEAGRDLLLLRQGANVLLLRLGADVRLLRKGADTLLVRLGAVVLLPGAYTGGEVLFLDGHLE